MKQFFSPKKSKLGFTTPQRLPYATALVALSEVHIRINVGDAFLFVRGPIRWIIQEKLWGATKQSIERFHSIEIFSLIDTRL